MRNAITQEVGLHCKGTNDCFPKMVGMVDGSGNCLLIPTQNILAIIQTGIDIMEIQMREVINQIKCLSQRKPLSDKIFIYLQNIGSSVCNFPCIKSMIVKVRCNSTIDKKIQNYQCSKRSFEPFLR